MFFHHHNQQQSQQQDEASNLSVEDKLSEIIKNLSPRIGEDKIICGFDSSWKRSNSLDYDVFCKSNEDKINKFIISYKGNSTEVIKALIKLAKTQEDTDSSSVSKEKICYLLLKCSESKYFKNITIGESKIPLKLYTIKLLAENDKTPDCYSLELLLKKLNEIPNNQSKSEIHDLIISQFLKLNEPSERLYETLFNSLNASSNKKDFELVFIKKLAKFYGSDETNSDLKIDNLKLLIKTTVLNLNNNINYKDFENEINKKYAFSSFLKKYEDKESLYQAIDNLIKEARDNNSINIVINPLSFLKLYIAENSSFNNTLKEALETFKNQNILLPPEKLDEIIRTIDHQKKGYLKIENTKALIDYIHSQYENNASEFFKSTYPLKDIKEKIYELIKSQDVNKFCNYIINTNEIKWGVINPKLLRELSFCKDFLQESFNKNVQDTIDDFLKEISKPNTDNKEETNNNSTLKNKFLYLIDILDSGSVDNFPSVLDQWIKSIRNNYKLDLRSSNVQDEKLVDRIFDVQVQIFEHCNNSQMMSEDNKKKFLSKILQLQYDFIENCCNATNKQDKLLKIFLNASEIDCVIFPNDKLSTLKPIIDSIIEKIKITSNNTEECECLLNFYHLTKLLSNDARDEYCEKLENYYKTSDHSSTDYRDIICKKLFEANTNPSFYNLSQLYSEIFELNPNIFIEKVLTHFDVTHKMSSDFANEFIDYIYRKHFSLNSNYKNSLIKEILLKSKEPEIGLVRYINRELSINSTEKRIENAIENWCNNIINLPSERNDNSQYIHPDIVFDAINILLKENKLHLTSFCYMLSLKYREMLGEELTPVQNDDFNKIADKFLVLLLKEKQRDNLLIKSVLGERLRDEIENNDSNLLLNWAVSVLKNSNQNNQQGGLSLKNFTSFLVQKKIITEENLNTFVTKLDIANLSEEIRKMIQVTNKH